MGKGDICTGKQDSYLFNMGGLRASQWVKTRVFSLHVGLSRHFTRLRHTLKRVICVVFRCFLL